MSDQIDQFGRDKSKPFSDDKSKKILESLAEIKNQLENKNYTPNVEVYNNASNHDFKSIKTKNLDLDQLQKRIEFLEEKLITLKNQTPLEDYKTESNIKDIIEFEKSIFHSFGNSHELDRGKSLLVLENQNKSEIFKFKFYHFIYVTITMIISLILLISFQLKISILETLNIFFSILN
jgi:5'-3' exonuclease